MISLYAKYFLDPVLLPCANNVCVEHVNQKITENNSQIYVCSLCNDTHEVQANGFTMNRIIIEMLNKNIHLKVTALVVKESIDCLDYVNKELDSISKDPEAFIYSYFYNNRNKIDLKRETLISKINHISDDMIAKIKEMETNCKSNLSEKQNLIDEEFVYINYVQSKRLNGEKRLEILKKVQYLVKRDRVKNKI